MVFAILLAVTGLTLSAVAIYYSVIGLTAVFAAAFWPVVIMGTTLEVAKLVAASWLKMYWELIPRGMKIYMTTAVVVLMFITSMGIFGFLSKAHLDQNLVSGDVVDKVAIIDEKIKTERDNIEASRKALKQMDEAVDQTMARSDNERGAERAVQIRRQQQTERNRLQNEIGKAQSNIAKLNEERAPIAKDLRKVEAEVGPIKYIAKLIYGDNPDTNILEKAVTWVIMIIVFVFDPLAVLLLLGAQMTWQWSRKKDQPTEQKEDTVDPDLPEPESTGYVQSPWPFPTAWKKEENVFDIIKSEDNVQQAPYHPGYEDVTVKDNAGMDEDPHPPGWMWPKVSGEATAPERFGLGKDSKHTAPDDKEVVEEDLIAEDDPEKEAKRRWKEDHPGETIKRQERLFENGIISELPWVDYLKAQPDFGAEEPKKKTTYIVKEQNQQVTKTKE